MPSRPPIQARRAGALKALLTRLNPSRQAILQNVVIWTVAGALLWYVGRGLTGHQVAKALADSNLTLFVSANLASLLIRWLVDTYLFSLLFSYFHGRTTYREVLPVMAAQYFLQAVNLLVADAALAVFLHRRKGVEWITAGWTLAFQGMLDAIVLAALTLTAGIAVPDSPIREALPYSAATLVFLLGVSAWWMRGKPSTVSGRWLRNRPAMLAFRTARPHHYAVLGLIRLAILSSNALLFYVELRAFGLGVPLEAALALSPALIFAQNAPLTPSGLGPLQIVMVWGFSSYAPRDRILTAALAISVVQLLCRIPLGIGAAGTFARRVLTMRQPDEYVEKDEARKLPTVRA